jgi:DNA-binding CsgD family transcriptional regulator/PAS domain-containing protein
MPHDSAALHADERLLDLVGDIYDCAIDPAKWPATLEAIADFVQVKAVGINVKDPGNRKVTFVTQWGGNPEYRKSYNERYFALNPAMTAGWFVGLDEPVTCSGFAGKQAWLRCRMYREWMEPQGYIDACGVNLTKNAQRHSMLSVIRTEEQGWFTEIEDRRLRLLSPHIRRAITIMDMLGVSALQQNALSQVIDLLTVGVVLTDEAGRIVYANRAAHALLEERSGVVKVNDRLSARDGRAAAALRDAIAAAGRGGAADIPRAGIAVPIPRRGADDLAAWVLPLDAGLRNEFAAPFGSRVAVFLRALDDDKPFPGELFVRRYGITPAECRVLALLTQGMALREAADALGVSETTAKTHLQHLFEKTGTRRQADLMRLATMAISPARVVGP